MIGQTDWGLIIAFLTGELLLTFSFQLFQLRHFPNKEHILSYNLLNVYFSDGASCCRRFSNGSEETLQMVMLDVALGKNKSSNDLPNIVIEAM